MAVDFCKSRTKENLMKAFAGESQARNRYTIAAEMAMEHHMYSVGQIFLFTADQERAHAQRYYELLKEAAGETIEICGGFPADTFDSLTDLLRAAEHNETEEYKDVYRSFGDQAKEEGFLEAASAFYQIAEVEKTHAKRFGKMRELMDGEDKKKPFSDQKLTDLLKEAGIGISRRTVAKYRMEMGIADASGRKSYR